MSTELSLTLARALTMVLDVSSMQCLRSGKVTFWLEEDFGSVFFEELDLLLFFEDDEPVRFVEDDETFSVVEDDEIAFLEDDDASFRMSSRSSKVNEELLSSETSSSLGMVIECLSLEHPARIKNIENAAARITFLDFMGVLLGLCLLFLI